jgi:hypothetical protein
MMKIPVLVTAIVIGMASPGLQADAITDTQNQYRAQGAGPFLFKRGEELWNRRPYLDRSCTDCHGADLHQPGRHQRTNKPIEPMAPSVSTGRYTDPDKMEKWFKRNCKWTWNRECTPQEKGDLLEYLKQL